MKKVKMGGVSKGKIVFWIFLAIATHLACKRVDVVQVEETFTNVVSKQKVIKKLRDRRQQNQQDLQNYFEND